MKSFLLFGVLLSAFISQGLADCGDRYQSIMFDSVTVTHDIIYGNNKTSTNHWIDLKMDIYQPFGDIATDRPVLIYMHGGSFLGGSKEQQEEVMPCTEMAKRGYVCVAIDYRVEENPLSLISPETMIKAVIRAVQDAKASIRFFRKDVAENGNTYGIDSSQIFIGGASAGAIAALHLAYLDDINELEAGYRPFVYQIGGVEGESGNPGYSSRINAVINVSGCLRDVSYMDNNTNIPVLSMHNVGDATIPYGYGKPYGIPTLPTTSGSKIISQHANDIGMYNIFISLPGVDHVPYEDGGVPEQPGYNMLMDSMTVFLYRQLDCNVATGITEYQKIPELKIYPNPAGKYFIIDKDRFGTMKMDKVRLYDISGKMVLERRTESEQMMFKDLGLDKGIYFLQAFDNEENMIGKSKIAIQ